MRPGDIDDKLIDQLKNEFKKRRGPDQRVETLVRTLVDHLAAFGGSPLVTVFDRPKTVALSWGTQRCRDGMESDVRRCAAVS